MAPITPVQGNLCYFPHQHGKSRLYILHQERLDNPIVRDTLLSRVMLLHCAIHPLQNEVSSSKCS